VVIATDDERIRAAAAGFGARVIMTRSDHASGTDRVAEAASSSDAQWVVNIQGDEPTLDPSAIDAAILGVLGQENALMGTLKTRITRRDSVLDPNVVKVVADCQDNAIYFSRFPIPYVREEMSVAHYKHIGLYIYQRDFLLAYPDLPVGPLEQAERLEQLRALENGFKIRVVETDYDSLGVDTPEDYRQVTELFEKTMVNR
jgi:3-deoxy-manno-octulosonate cytidylyltransferase (CMP-KDO synthetase)